MSNSEFRKALDSAQELKIAFVGRKSGKKFSTPVWFVNEGEKVYLLPVSGTTSNWYKNVLKNPKLDLQVSGAKTSAQGHPIEDKKQIEKVVELFKSKYGVSDVKNYYPRQDAAVELTV
jgi:deazaflavin-dependent oxidoreductase (nitroreductase family)